VVRARQLVESVLKIEELLLCADSVEHIEVADQRCNKCVVTDHNFMLKSFQLFMPWCEESID
jgi:hypothetical protein